MQHLWFTERVIDIVAHELELDPVEVRKRNYIKTEDMPYETPNGCVYDSGDYSRMLDIALDLIGWDGAAEKRQDAAARGKLLGVGIGSTLDSGTNNFGQSRMINPELQFSGNNEVATVKLDIFGEIVVTLGTTPQGQGHETTAAQVVADILGCSIDDVHVRAGHDSYWNSHAGFSGTYASQFAVTGLSAVKGATDMLAEQIKRLGSVILGGVPVEALELADGTVRIKDNPEAALPFMACGAIINANNAGLPEDLDVTLNCRYVYRPPFEVPDVERKFGNLTLTYAAQIHAAVVEIDPETGHYEIVDYAAVDDCGIRIHPQIVEGQVMGATAQAIGAVDARGVRVRRGREPPDAQLLRLPRAARARHAAAADRLHREPVAVHAARHEGDGRGRRRRHPRRLRGGAGRAARARRRDRLRQLEPVQARVGDAPASRAGARARRGRGRVNVEGERIFDAPRATVWQVLNDPSSMAQTMPGVESFDVHDDKRWTANVKIPLGLGGLKMKIDMEKTEEREPEFAAMHIKGQGVGAMMNMQTTFDAQRRAGGGTHDEVDGGREDRRPGRLDGPARPAADREPAGAARARRARPAGPGAVARPEGLTWPFRIGVMQLTMEPLDEMLASARVMDEAGMDTIWLAEAYPWWRKHGMEARSSTVVSALMARETERLTIGWGIISPFTRHPVQVAMDARVVQEAAGPGRFILGFGTSKIFLNNAGMQTSKTLGPMRDAVEIVRGVLGGEAFEYEGSTWNANVPALQAEAHTPRDVPPVYVAATAPKMQALAGEIGDGCLTPSITTPPFVRYTRENVGADIDIGCTVVASIHETDRDAGRDGAREIAGMYLANKVQNIQGSADTLLDLAGIEQDEIRPVAEAMEQGGRLAAKAQVTDALLDKCKPIAGTPDDCIAAIEEYRDAGLHARDARALGREPARADPALRRARAATLPRVIDRMLAEARSRIARYTPPRRLPRTASCSSTCARPTSAASTASFPARCTCRARCSSGVPIRRRRRTTRSSPGAGSCSSARRDTPRVSRRRRSSSSASTRAISTAGSRRGPRPGLPVE